VLRIEGQYGGEIEVSISCTETVLSQEEWSGGAIMSVYLDGVYNVPPHWNTLDPSSNSNPFGYNVIFKLPTKEVSNQINFSGGTLQVTEGSEYIFTTIQTKDATVAEEQPKKELKINFNASESRWLDKSVYSELKSGIESASLQHFLLEVL
jgi:hypothetical protein